MAPRPHQLELFAAAVAPLAATERPATPRLPPGVDPGDLPAYRWLATIDRARRTSPLVWPRAIIHADLDCFFVAVERLLDPSLVGRPVIVGGDPQSRGVVCSASYEARASGVRSAMPSAQAARLCPEAVFIPPSGPYGEYSQRVKAIMHRFTPHLQMMSVDEAYLDVTDSSGLHADPVTLAHRLRVAVHEETGLPISLGVATSRLVSKVAGKRAKPAGLVAIRPGGEPAFLGAQPLRAIPGLGEKSSAALEAYGLKTVAQLRDLGPERMDILCGAGHGRALYWRLLGVDPSPVRAGGEPKSCGREHTFEKDISDPTKLRSILSELADRVAADLRHDGGRAGRLTLKMRFPDFATTTRCASFEPPTNDPLRLLQVARELFDRHHHGEPLRLLGLSASRLALHQWQPDLLAEAALAASPDPARITTAPLDRHALWEALDEIRARHGRQAVSLGLPQR